MVESKQANQRLNADSPEDHQNSYIALDYDNYLEVINREFVNFVDEGQALKQIRDQRLFRGRYSNWETFCSKEVGCSKTQANRKIRSSEMVLELRRSYASDKNPPNLTQILPKKEAHVRPLLTLRDPKATRLIWDKVITQTKDRKLTADLVKRIVVESGQSKSKQPKPRSQTTDRQTELLEIIARQLEDGIEGADWSLITDALDLVEVYLED